METPTKHSDNTTRRDPAAGGMSAMTGKHTSPGSTGKRRTGTRQQYLGAQARLTVQPHEAGLVDEAMALVRAQVEHDGWTVQSADHEASVLVLSRDGITRTVLVRAMNGKGSAVRIHLSENEAAIVRERSDAVELVLVQYERSTAPVFRVYSAEALTAAFEWMPLGMGLVRRTARSSG